MRAARASRAFRGAAPRSAAMRIPMRPRSGDTAAKFFAMLVGAVSGMYIFREPLAEWSQQQQSIQAKK